MTIDEEARAERIRRLQERRGGTQSPSSNPMDQDLETTKTLNTTTTLETMNTDDARAERIRRLQERRGGTPAHEPAGGGTPTQPLPLPPAQEVAKPVRRRHAAEASRIAVAGAGATLTLALVATMARAEVASIEAPVPEGPAVSPTIMQLAQAIPATPTTMAPVPIVVVPINVETKVVHLAAPSRGGGTVSAPVGAPAPAPTTKSNGSK
ncbi:MAG: hypothetical protein OEX04_12020 [Acidimicrobiia bacterium]|nr:hypothetical protein [Acidimicrobiia bacterium]MDH4308194.1 hypothetical protein [Acidimicrobiia bacterium]